VAIDDIELKQSGLILRRIGDDFEGWGRNFRRMKAAMTYYAGQKFAQNLARSLRYGWGLALRALAMFSLILKDSGQLLAESDLYPRLAGTKWWHWPPGICRQS